MEGYIRVTAKTVEDAVIEASIQLGTSSDNIEYRVIDEGSKGFLGIGAKKAVIEAKPKKTDEDFVNEIIEAASEKKKDKKEKKEKKAEKKEEKPEKKAEKKEEKKAEKAEKKEEKKVEKAEKAEKKEEKKAEKAEKAERAEKAEKKEEKKAESFEVKEEKQEETVSSREPADPQVAMSRAKKFLEDVFKAMDTEVIINQTWEDGSLVINLEGEDMGVLIGKRGQTLDSLQYLISLVVNRGNAAYVRVKLDTENYRERRKATLENLAKNIAFKVKKTRKSVYLEPMNPYERRIIHSALQNDPYVSTHSEGEEPCRKVVVTMKKREKVSYQDMDE